VKLKMKKKCFENIFGVFVHRKTAKSAAKILKVLATIIVANTFLLLLKTWLDVKQTKYF